MSEQIHNAPLQHEVPVELTRKTDLDYRGVAESVGTIIKQKEALAASHIDSLTGLPDKKRFDEDREAIINRALTSRRPVGMAIIDGLGFKDINDTFGHATGDKALAHMGNRIKEAIRPTDIAYRIGGDEFAVLMPDFGIDSNLSDDELNKITGQRIEDSVQEGVDLIGFPEGLKVRVSAGVGMLQPGETGAELQHRVDSEMYARKHEQKQLLEAAGETISR